MAAAGMVLKAVTDSARSAQLRKQGVTGTEESIASRQAAMVAATRSSLYELLDGPATASDIVAFFDSNVIDMVQRREDVFAASMMTAYKDELSTQVQAAYAKAAAAAARADRFEKDVQTLHARLSRRSDGWDTERAAMYRQILALRELLRRHGVEASKIASLSAQMNASGGAGAAGGSDDDPLGAAKSRALEARLRRSEAALATAKAQQTQSSRLVERLRQEAQELQDRVQAMDTLAESAKMENQRLRQELDRARASASGRPVRSTDGFDGGSGGGGGAAIGGSGGAAAAGASEGKDADGGGWTRGGAAWGETERREARAAVAAGKLDWEEAAESLAELLIEPALKQAVDAALQRQSHGGSSSRDSASALPTTRAEMELRMELDRTRAELARAAGGRASLEAELRQSRDVVAAEREAMTKDVADGGCQTAVSGDAVSVVDAQRMTEQAVEEATRAADLKHKAELKAAVSAALRSAKAEADDDDEETESSAGGGGSAGPAKRSTKTKGDLATPAEWSLTESLSVTGNGTDATPREQRPTDLGGACGEDSGAPSPVANQLH
ncbi:hypothetical protein FNF28_06982 [Cafeteria roenbergensis]|uniref:Uncharacterized protein n=1 Tax=Cafeteria roenbergensis TaxID=33653 RepID=A0A5A8CJ84_CAFRO|nr:hypothetical protein FNF28_06982 [Cafeteria roenbergensis]